MNHSTSVREDSRPSRHDWRLFFLLGLGCTVFYLGFTPGSFKGSDEVGVFQVTEALYTDGRLAVPIHHHAHLGADGRLYHAWATGQSVLALPFYALSRLAESTLPPEWTRALAGPSQQSSRKLRAERVAELRGAGLDIRRQTLRFGGRIEIFFVCLYAPVVGGLLVATFFALLRELGASARAALTAAALTGLCSQPAMMSVYFLRHTTETVTTLGAFALFHAYRRGGRVGLLALGSLLASSTFLVRVPGVLSGLGLGLYAGWCLRDRLRAGAPRGRSLLALAGPLLLALAVHLWLDHQKWGSPFASPMLAGGLERSDAFWTALSAFLWSPGISVFAYSPLLLLLPWTFGALWRTHPRECIAFVVVALTELLYFSGYRFWTGLWSAPGPRYLFPGCVLLMLPLGVWLDGQRPRWQRLALWVLAAAGGVIQLALMTASWRGVIRSERYADYDPPFSFLFDPVASPIAASLRVTLEGNLDTWLWKLGSGWSGQDPQPAVAAALALLWITAGAVLLIWIRRAAARQG